MSKINRREFLISTAPLTAVPFLLPILAGNVSAAEMQAGWRFCTKCSSLFWGGGVPDKAGCAAGGPHDRAGYIFQLPYNVPATAKAQSDWRFCDKCFGLFWNGYPDKGRCSNGGGHHMYGFDYVIPHDVPPNANNQDKWRFCGKCKAMFYDGYPSKGRCPAGDGHAAAGYGFVLPFIQPQAASPPAPTGGFRRVATEPFGGVVAVVNRVKALANPALPREASVDLGPVIRQAWNTARTRLTDEGKAFLNERDIGGGFRTSRTDIALATNGDLYVGTDGNGFTLRYVLRGNSIETSIRVPGPTPSGTDPRFNVRFDVDVTMEVDRSGLALSAGSARLRLTVSRPTGANITGDLVIAANNLFATISGKDFIGQGLKAVNSSDIALNKPVNYELGKILGGRVGRGIAIVPSFDRGRSRLVIALEDEGTAPIVH